MADQNSFNESERHAQEIIGYAYEISRSKNEHTVLSNLHRLLEKRQMVCNELVNANAMNSEHLIKMIDEINRQISLVIMIPLPERKLK